MKRVVFLLTLMAAVAGMALVAFRVWPRTTPPGQTPLQTLSALHPLRASFNDGHGEYRVLALLSPTCGVCTSGASVLGSLVGMLPSGACEHWSSGCPSSAPTSDHRRTQRSR